jgi:hypothetical protein
VQRDLSTLCDVLLTGNCDAKRHAEMYPTLAEVTADLQKKAAAAQVLQTLPAPKRRM